MPEANFSGLFIGGRHETGLRAGSFTSVPPAGVLHWAFSSLPLLTASGIIAAWGLFVFWLHNPIAFLKAGCHSNVFIFLALDIYSIAGAAS